MEQLDSNKFTANLPRDEEGNIIGTDMAKYGPGPVGERGPLGR